MTDRATFERYVQQALNHLYDHAYLQVHQLAALLLPRGTTEALGPALHRVLREAVDLLKPPPDAPYHSPAWRTYRYLSLRYVEMLTIGQVAEELGISPRQCRRDHHDALSAINSVLWDRYRRLQESGARQEPADFSDRPSGGQIVDGLLDAEVDRIGSASEATVTILDRTVESVLSTLSALAASKHVHLSAAIPPDIPPVAVHRTALRQALLGLLLYAVDWGAGGQVVLDALAGRGQVRLNVFVRRPAEPSPAQGWEAAREDTRLAVSQRLVEMQGGTLAVVPQPGSLSICLSLPPSEPQVVLVVDDNSDVVHLLRDYLSGGYQVVEATSGEQAIRLAREVRPTVVTLDVMMPSQDGWEVLQILKNDPATSGVPIVVCSVLRERELALSLGAADFLAKPIAKQELLSALRRCRVAG